MPTAKETLAKAEAEREAAERDRAESNARNPRHDVSPNDDATRREVPKGRDEHISGATNAEIEAGKAALAGKSPPAPARRDTDPVVGTTFVTDEADDEAARTKPKS